jgi:hypothetical protein
VTTFPTRTTGTTAGRPPRTSGARPASTWAFAGAVYPRFAARQHDRPLPAWVLTGAATAFAVYGLWATIQHSGS